MLERLAPLAQQDTLVVVLTDDPDVSVAHVVGVGWLLVDSEAIEFLLDKGGLEGFGPGSVKAPGFGLQMKQVEE